MVVQLFQTKSSESEYKNMNDKNITRENHYSLFAYSWIYGVYDTVLFVHPLDASAIVNISLNTDVWFRGNEFHSH